MPHKPGILTIAVGLLLGLLVSCSSESAIATSQSEFETQCWNVTDSLVMSFQNEDTLQVCTLAIPITFNEDYSYHNIYVRMKVTAPSGESKVLDAVQYGLMDGQGNWYGEVSGSSIEFELSDGIGLRLNQLGNYEFRLFHYMRDDLLCGIENAGLNLYRFISQ